jgi:hypothetical protein
MLRDGRTQQARPAPRAFRPLTQTLPSNTRLPAKEEDQFASLLGRETDACCGQARDGAEQEQHPAGRLLRELGQLFCVHL